MIRVPTKWISQVLLVLDILKDQRPNEWASLTSRWDGPDPDMGRNDYYPGQRRVRSIDADLAEKLEKMLLMSLNGTAELTFLEKLYKVCTGRFAGSRMVPLDDLRKALTSPEDLALVNARLDADNLRCFKCQKVLSTSMSLTISTAHSNQRDKVLYCQRCLPATKALCGHPFCVAICDIDKDFCGAHSEESVEALSVPSDDHLRVTFSDPGTAVEAPAWLAEPYRVGQVYTMTYSNPFSTDEDPR